ncbi:hypothetical protein BAPKO_3503 (plasmid) [Borreliella afzelii PKo]|nr:hypothetical protein BAPKO_3503 [Borreliella afzelii PKo]
MFFITPIFNAIFSANVVFPTLGLAPIIIKSSFLKPTKILSRLSKPVLKPLI